ncbi:MAG: DUF4347 domain-containing protein, partial [Pseudonocardiaceae bacterium]
MTTLTTKGRKPARFAGFRPRRHMLALEPRFLFDGAAAATVDQQEPAPPEPQESQQADTELVAAEQLVQPGTAKVSESSLTDALALIPETSGSEVVFVDTTVENYAELLTGISPFAEVIILDSGRDGIQQISAALAGRENLQAVHILSHGTDGAVRLGNLWLQDSNLDQYADAIAGWATALSADADLLIYGCNLVSSEVGRSFVTALSGLTGADVAASENATGHASLGGDWDLEFKTGTIEAQIAISDVEQNAWYHTLAVPTFLGFGSVGDNANAITPGLPSSLVEGDMLLLFAETANQAVTIANQNGGTWTEITPSQGIGTTAAGTRLTVFWSRYNGTQVAPTTSDSGNNPGSHQVGQIYAFRGVVPTGNPVNITSGGSEAADNSLSVPGATTTVADTLVVVAASISMQLTTDNFGATWTNASLANFTLLNNVAGTAGNDGRIAVLTGEKATAGAYGATTNTLNVATNTKGYMTIALAPNIAPVVGNLNTDALAYSEGDGAQLIDQGAGATVTDVDSANFNNGALTVSFTAGSDAAEDVLAIRNQGVAPGQIGVAGANVTYGGTIIGTFVGGAGGANLVITFNANATPTAVQALVQNITFQDTDTNAPTTGARTVQFVVTD